MSEFLRFFDTKLDSFSMHLEIYYSKVMDWSIRVWRKGAGENGMTERERELCRSSYAAQLDSLGYGPDGTPKDKKTAWPDWISVKDRLPAPDDFVLFTAGKDVFYGYHDGKDWYNYEGCWDTDVIYLEPGERITHWMPLPEPPKEGT